MSKVSDHFAAEGYVGRRYLLLVLGGRVVLILVALAFGNGLLSPRALVSVMIAYAACVALRSSRKRPNRPSSWRFSTIFYITRAFRLFVLWCLPLNIYRWKRICSQRPVGGSPACRARFRLFWCNLGSAASTKRRHVSASAICLVWWILRDRRFSRIPGRSHPEPGRGRIAHNTPVILKKGGLLAGFQVAEGMIGIGRKCRSGCRDTLRTSSGEVWRHRLDYLDGMLIWMIGTFFWTAGKTASGRGSGDSRCSRNA